MNFKCDRYGSFGAIVAAAACPVCFPKLALIGALVGFGAFAQYEIYFFIATQLLVMVSLMGAFMAFKKHANYKILSLAAVSAGLFFASLYVVVSEYLSYFSLAGLVAAIIWQLSEVRKYNGLHEVRDIEEQ